VHVYEDGSTRPAFSLERRVIEEQDPATGRWVEICDADRIAAALEDEAARQAEAARDDQERQARLAALEAQRRAAEAQIDRAAAASPGEAPRRPRRGPEPTRDWQLLRRVIDRLVELATNDQDEAIRLRYIAYEAVADAAGVSESTARTELSRRKRRE